MEEIKELQKGITDILVAIGKIETELKQVSSMASKVDDTIIAVARIERDLNTCYKKVDTISDRVSSIERRIDDDKKAAKEDKKWLAGFVVGAVALVWKLMDYVKGGNAS